MTEFMSPTNDDITIKNILNSTLRDMQFAQ